MSNISEIAKITERFEERLQTYIGEYVTESNRVSIRECIRDYVREVNSIEAIEGGVDLSRIDCHFILDPKQHKWETDTPCITINDYTDEILRKISAKVDLHSDESMV